MILALLYKGDVSMNDLIAKERRDTILEILHSNYPNPVGEKVVASLVSEAGYPADEEQVIKDLNYLKGKNMVEIEEVGNKQYGMKRTISKITAEGIDYLEGVR
jgi:hypothetical protein